MKLSFGSRSASVCLAGALAAVGVSLLPYDTSAQGRIRRGSETPAAADRDDRPNRQARQSGPQLDRARGAAEAPAIVRAAGLTCTIADAAFVGSTPDNRNGYEVACREGLGYIVTAPSQAGGAAQVFDCVNVDTTFRAAQASGQGGAPQCRLPGNAQPARGLQAYVAQAGAACTINNARYIGDSRANNTVRYEVGCAEGPGYVVDRPRAAGARATAQTCFRAEAGGPFRCQFTPRAQSLAALAPLVAQARRQCTISDARIVGVKPQTRNEVVEVGCQGAPGFLIETAPTGGFVQAYDCGRLGNAPCQFTAAAQVQALNAADYSRLLRASGFDCAVANFSRLGDEANTGRDIVEVACSNRPDGAFAILAENPGQRSEVYDCLLAPKRGQQCQLTKAEALYPRLSAAITGSQRSNCTVVNHRRMGSTPQGEDWYEVSCSQGRNAVVDYRGNGQVRQVLRCPDAAQVLGGCKLPVPGRS